MEGWNINPFKFNHLPETLTRKEWMRWKRNFEVIVAASEEKNATKLKNILLAKGGLELQDLFYSIDGADVVEDKEKGIDPYKTAIGKLDQHFSPKQHDSFERNEFCKLSPATIQDGTCETLSKFLMRDGDEFLWTKIGGVLVQVLIDSGSSKNIIDDTTWDYMKKQGVKSWVPRNVPYTTLRGYGREAKPLKILNVFEAIISVESSKCKFETTAMFYVVEGGLQSLLGKETAKCLGVLKIGLTNPEHSINTVTPATRPFPKMKNVQVRIPVNQDVTPIVQRARRPPIALLSRIEEKLDQLLATDIIEPVSGPSPWVSPLVTIVKDNGDIRLCVDMRRPNQAIQREHHVMPTFEDFLPHLKSSRFFSRLDIKDAFHQIELEESSRYITTFICNKGLFRYKRLMFGISCAPEMFQKILEHILSDCDNVVNYLDDILVSGETEEEHDESLRKVLRVLETRNVLLNKDKCIFKVKQIEFLGHLISSEGIKPTASKIEALQKFREPKTPEEVRSFLGLVTYVEKFIPDLATITEPLRQLICKDNRFAWERKHQSSFELLKRMIANVHKLSFFNNSLRTRVIADASPVALGAVLVQFEGRNDADPRIISYASKSLTTTEKRYCQTEKEALALVWAVEKFSIYLVGREFELETDHKPLEIIFSPSSTPCARIERWVLRLQSFKFTVKYRKGSGNIADSLSRLVVPENPVEFETDNHFLVLAVQESAAVDVGEIEDATRTDPVLKAVKDSLVSGNWNNPLVKPYEPFRNELGLIEDTIVRGNKLVVPQDLRPRMLQLAHEGHPGESIMKRRLRDRAWWPAMDREAKDYVSGCEGCQLIGIPNKPLPMSRRELPTKPWIDVAIDFMGPLPSGEYLLVIVDYFSRYKEVEIMTRINSRDTVERLVKIFTRLGYPRTITLDNAKQFIGKEYGEFCKIHGIVLNHTAPYWPQENGLVERQNRSLLKRLQISNALKRDWKKDLNDYLLMYYTTPHSTTGKTPTELCYGRTIRSKLPSIEDIETTPISSDYRDQDKINKEKGKEREDRRRHAQESDIQRGDTVLMENLLPSNKLATTFSRTKYTVLDRAGPRATVEDQDTGKTFERNIAHFKRIRPPPTEAASTSVNITGTGEDTTQATTSTDVIAPCASTPTVSTSLFGNEAEGNNSSDGAEDNFRGFDNEELADTQRTRRLPPRFNDFVM